MADQRSPVTEQQSTAKTTEEEMKMSNTAVLSPIRDAQAHSHNSKSAVFWQQVQHEQDSDGQTFQCPYCLLVAPLDVEVSTRTRLGLTTHIKRSSKTRISARGDWVEDLAEAHDELKAADGWYDDDFSDDSDWQEDRQSQDFELDFERWRMMRNGPAFQFSTEKELKQPIPVPGHPQLHFGAFNGSIWSDPAQAKMFKVVDLSKPVDEEEKQRLHDDINHGYLKNHLKLVDFPGTGNNTTYTSKYLDAEPKVLKAVPLPTRSGQYLDIDLTEEALNEK